MQKPNPLPPSCSLIQKGSFLILLKEEYKDLLLQQGIDDFDDYLKRCGQPSPHLTGRTPHLSVSLKNGEKMVVRRYSHGGLLHIFTRGLYLFGSRAFQELALTEEVRSSGIPTIQPIGAIQQAVFPFIYRAFFLSLEIPRAKDLSRRLQNIGPVPSAENLLKKREMIKRVGRLVRQFHQAGFFHRDLQLKNILIAGDKPFLIDFDRSYRKKTLPPRDRIDNLLRLNRSVDKWRRAGLPITRTDRWRFFLTYSEGDQTIRKALGEALRTYAIRFFLHRCIWARQRVLSSEFGVRSKKT
jgi:3-deoxy-D-manno-octulosonic acid kinase